MKSKMFSLEYQATSSGRVACDRNVLLPVQRPGAQLQLQVAGLHQAAPRVPGRPREDLVLRAPKAGGIRVNFTRIQTSVSQSLRPYSQRSDGEIPHERGTALQLAPVWSTLSLDSSMCSYLCKCRQRWGGLLPAGGNTATVHRTPWASEFGWVYDNSWSTGIDFDESLEFDVDFSKTRYYEKTYFFDKFMTMIQCFLRFSEFIPFLAPKKIRIFGAIYLL